MKKLYQRIQWTIVPIFLFFLTTHTTLIGQQSKAQQIATGLTKKTSSDQRSAMLVKYIQGAQGAFAEQIKRLSTLVAPESAKTANFNAQIQTAFTQKLLELYNQRHNNTTELATFKEFIQKALTTNFISNEHKAAIQSTLVQRIDDPLFTATENILQAPVKTDTLPIAQEQPAIEQPQVTPPIVQQSPVQELPVAAPPITPVQPIDGQQQAATIAQIASPAPLPQPIQQTPQPAIIQEPIPAPQTVAIQQLPEVQAPVAQVPLPTPSQQPIAQEPIPVTTQITTPQTIAVQQLPEAQLPVIQAPVAQATIPAITQPQTKLPALQQATQKTPIAPLDQQVGKQILGGRTGGSAYNPATGIELHASTGYQYNYKTREIVSPAGQRQKMSDDFYNQNRQRLGLPELPVATVQQQAITNQKTTVNSEPIQTLQPPLGGDRRTWSPTHSKTPVQQELPVVVREASIAPIGGQLLGRKTGGTSYDPTTGIETHASTGYQYNYKTREIMRPGGQAQKMSDEFYNQNRQRLGLPELQTVQVSADTIQPTAQALQTIENIYSLTAQVQALHNVMQKAVGHSYNAETQRIFATELVKVFNKVRTMQTYISQLLVGASKTTLLNKEQQNYVRTFMVPGLAFKPQVLTTQHTSSAPTIPQSTATASAVAAPATTSAALTGTIPLENLKKKKKRRKKKRKKKKSRKKKSTKKKKKRRKKVRKKRFNKKKS